MQSEWCHPSLTGTAPSWEITNHRSFKQGQGLDSAPGTGDRATLAVCMDWGMRLDSSCGKGLGFWWMARWIWVSGVLAARRAQPCPREPLKAGDRPALLWPGAPHPSAGGRLGHHETRKTLSFRQSSKEAMRIVKGLEGKPYGELLRSFDLFSWKTLRRPHCSLQLPCEGEGRSRHWSLHSCEQWQDPGEQLELSQDRLMLDTRKHFHPENGWALDRLARKCWQEFKKGLDNTLGQMVWILGMTRTKELDSMILEGLFQLSTFYDWLRVHLQNK